MPTALALAALPLAIAQAYGEEVTATWIGASGGSYGSPASWDIGAVPLNNGDQTYIVDIGSNFTVNYSVAGAQAIDALSLGKSFFALSSSDPMNRSVLTVLDAATIGGSISATGASFIATGAGTSFVGNTSTLAALGGGVVRIAAPSFDASGLNAATILNASGAGSLIDLSSVKTFNAGSSGPNGNSIVASNGGSIDLSGVTALTAPANAAALTFNLSGASNVDLSSLQTVGGVTTDTGYTNFVLDGSSATVGPLQKANRLGVTLKDGSTMTLGGYGGSATVTNSGFVVSGGSKLDASTLVGTLSERGLNASTFLSASDAGSLIDLSGLQTLDAGSTGPNGNAVQIAGGAKIDLSGVQALVAPGNTAALTFNLTGGSSLDLSSLQTVGGVTTDSGYTNLVLDGSTATVGPLQKANRLGVTLSNGSTMTLGGFDGSAAVTNSGFVVSGGSVLDASRLAGSLTERGLNASTFLNASGTGSLIDLSGLQTLDAGSSGPNGNAIQISGGATIDLSGVKTLVAPANTAALTFNLAGASSVDLSSLQTIGGVTTDSGTTSFVLDGSVATLGPLQSANRFNATLKNGSTMTLGGFSGTAALTNSGFAVSGGSKLNAAKLVGSLSERGLNASTFLNAADLGSLIDLSGLQTLDAGSGGPNGNAISASGGATINLSGVTTLVAPANTAALSFGVTGGSSIDLSALQTIGGVTADSGYTSFTLDGSAVTIGPLQKANRLGVTLNDGSTMTIGGFAGTAAVTNSSFVVSGGSQLDASRLVGSYGVTGLNASNFLQAAGLGSSIDLSGIQTLNAGSIGPNGNGILASSGGRIDLSGVTALTAPGNAAALTFTVTGGSNVDLSSLQTVGGVTTDTGYTNFVLDGSSAVVGPLQKANRLGVTLKDGSTMTLGGYGGSATVTNSGFVVSGGSKLDASTLVGTLSERGLNASTFLSASDAGSLIDLSGLQTLDAGSTGPNGNAVQIAGGAKIDLSGVQALVAPGNTAALTFNLTGGSSLDLSSLQAVGGVTTDSGYTNLVLDGSTATVGPLQSANRLGVTLTNGAAMTIGGFAGDAALTNSGFVVSGGSKLDASRLVGSLNESGLNASTFLNASGAGSLINLSGLRTLDVGSNGPNGNAIQASSGAKIDLSGVTSLQPPVNSAAISINASGGSIDLSSLQTINGIPVGQSVRGSAGAGNALLTGGPGQVAFNVSGAGSLLLHGMAVGSGVHFNLTDTGSTLTLNGGLTLLAGSTLSAGSGTQVDVDGSYSFQQTVESQVATDLATLAMTNAGGHVVEVGGKDNGRPTGTGTVTSNFAWGQLDVGQAGTANTVELADLVDNGNRTSTSAEALYLNGGSGVSGLHILGGSTLVLDRVDLYSMENGQWTYINGLFGAGVTRIAYDQGYIALVPEPGSLALLLSGLGLVGIRLRRAKVRE